MLDIHGRVLAEAEVVPNVEFLRIELSPLVDGMLFVALIATTIDENEAQLLDQEILSARVTSLDEVLALIKRNVAVAVPMQRPAGGDSSYRFRNFYRCARCGHEWTDDWSALCDDDCPHCGARHMSPYRSEDIEPEAEHG